MRTALLLLLSGCGLGVVDDGAGGGGANLPTLGAGPYGRLDSDLDTPAQEPFIVADRFESFDAPACLARPGGGYRLWFVHTTDADATPRLGAAGVSDLRGLPDVAPHDVFDPGGPIAAPMVVRDGGDADLLLWYEADGAVRAATSDDGGESWDDAGSALDDATAPTGAVVDGVYHLFFVRDGAIWHASGPSPTDLTPEDVPTITARPTLDEAFDAREVGDPFLLVETSDAGRRHWGLWFTGVADGDATDPDAGPRGPDTAIGYAGSFDGERWERFGGADPVLTAPASDPCVVLEGARGVMFHTEEQRLHLGVAVAIHP